MKRKQDNERMSNKKKAIIAGIVTGVVAVAVAFSIYLDHSANKDVPQVDTNTPGIETMIEDTTPDINDVLPDSELDITIEEATEVDDVETDEEVATETTQESESIVESETTEEETKEETKEETSIVESETTESGVSEETAKEDTTKTEPAPEPTPAPETTPEQAKESTEVQPVYDNPTPPQQSSGEVSGQAALDVFRQMGINVQEGLTGDGSAAGVMAGTTWQ